MAACGSWHHWGMDNLLDIILLVVGLFTTMSALLYVLATIDPQTEAAPQRQQAAPQQPELSAAR